MLEDAPTVIVLLSAIAVNLRMAMYSASLAPHLGHAPLWQRALIGYMNVDQTYAVSVLKYEAAPQMTLPEKVAYLFGTCLPLVPIWYAATLVGAILGQSIPTDWGLEFAVPVTFIAMIAPALRTPAHIAAAVSSVLLALAFAGMPYNLGLLPAGIGAMIVGAEVERRMGVR
jgi:predicted branched-subunit amino acid permease